MAAGVLAAATLLTYSPALRCEFINVDDGVYVFDNPQVLAGPTPAGLRWACTTFRAANWHPLTWISLMLDVRLYGTGPCGFHITNIGLHTANTLVLFVLLCRLAGKPGRAFVVAGLFARHPLHVESVAWIAERKDVLSTLFGLLAMLAYVRYAHRPSLDRYSLMAHWPVVVLRGAWATAINPNLTSEDGRRAKVDAELVGAALGCGEPRALDTPAVASAARDRLTEAKAFARRALANRPVFW